MIAARFLMPHRRQVRRPRGACFARRSYTCRCSWLHSRTTASRRRKSSAARSASGRSCAWGWPRMPPAQHGRSIVHQSGAQGCCRRCPWRHSPSYRCRCCSSIAPPGWRARPGLRRRLVWRARRPPGLQHQLHDVDSLGHLHAPTSVGHWSVAAMCAQGSTRPAGKLLAQKV